MLRLRILHVKLIVILFLFAYRSSGQEKRDTTSAPQLPNIVASEFDGIGFLPSIIPPSPNMSSLAKFVEHRVNNYSGLTSIKIPVYTIVYKDIILPIEISYHHAGNKVEEVPSWVGLGWSLTGAGGAITRAVRGLPDDRYNVTRNITGAPNDCDSFDNAGYLYSGSFTNDMYNDSLSVGRNDRLRLVGMGAKDAISDLYYFSFGKYSGHFLFDHSGNISIVPQQDLKIEVMRPSNREITGFTVTTPEGIQYIFTDAERSIINSARYSDALYYNGSYHNLEAYTSIYGPFFGIGTNGNTETDLCGNELNRIAYNSSWHLTKIVSAVSGEEVLFTYRNENSEQCSYSNESLFWWIRGMDDTAFRLKTAVSNFVKTKLVQSITWPKGTIVFQIDELNPRQDTQNHGLWPNYALDKITVSGSEGPIKTFKLNYSYFQSAVPDFGTDMNNSDYTYLENEFAKRLRLDSFTEVGAAPHIFTYNTTPLPHRASTEQDFWGFYKPNGSNSLIPITYEYPGETVDANSLHTSKYSIYKRQSYVGTEILHNSFAFDRSTDTVSVKAGILTEITYPTGGKTRFHYQSNEFFIDGQKIVGGGLRIRQIQVSPSGTFEAPDDIIRNFDYHNSGKIIDLPVFAAYTATGDDGVMFHGNSSAGLAVTQGSFVGYSETTEEIAGSGKIKYKFLMPVTYGTPPGVTPESGSLYTRPSVEKAGNIMTGFFGTTSCSYSTTPTIKDYYPRPFAPNYEWARGLIDEKQTFDQDGKLLKKEKYEYWTKAAKTIRNVQVMVTRVDPWAIPEFGMNNCFRGYHEYVYTKMYDISPWIVNSKITTYTYDQANNTVVEEKENFFDSAYHKQLTATRRTTSKGRLEVKYKYPAEYQTVPGKAAFIQKLIDAHRLSEPLEVVTAFEALSSVQKVVNASVRTYKTFVGPVSRPELLLPYKTFSYQGVDGVTSFTAYSGTSDEAASASYRQDLQYTHYDNKGNPLSISVREGDKISYLWAYDGLYPVAQILNADYGAVASALAGASSSHSSLSSVTSSATISSVTSALRNALPNSEVTTYTYKSLIGIESVTDPGGKVLYYQYDALGRLSGVRNTNSSGAIRASYCYNYAGQTVPCTALAPTGSIAASSLSLIYDDKNNSLPVSLTDFQVQKVEQSAYLTWTTTSEQNSDHFQVQRSPDGSAWETLGTVMARGESEGLVSYRYTDGTPGKGLKIYRLKMNDKDGSFEYSPLRSLQFDGESVLYPNPVSVSEQINLRIDDLSVIRDIRVYGAEGSLKVTSQASRSIDVRSLTAGLYIVQITYTDGSVTTHRIVKQ